MEVNALEGDHYSILRGPGVEALAARLSSCLERAHAAGAARAEARQAGS